MATHPFQLDSAHSAIHFSVRHMVVAKVRGRFGAYRARLALDEADLTQSQLEVVIDAGSIDTGVADRDAHLRSADFLDVERFPTLRYQSRKIERLGADRYRIIGDLTIRDVTREVTVDVERDGTAKDPWGNWRSFFTAKASIDRNDFGLRWNQVLEAGGVLVGDRVDIEAEMQIVREEPRAASDEARA